MLSHGQIWSAIDALAASRGLTPSGLAKRAGLDPTAFNRSKRATPDGRLRWPSTESLAKALQAVGASFDEFASFTGSQGGSGRPRTLPLIGLAAASAGNAFDRTGAPTGPGWDEVAFPNLGDEAAYGLEIEGDGLLPLYRDSDIVIVSPRAAIRRGDRVVARTRAGEILIGLLKRQTVRTIELAAPGSDRPDRSLSRADLAWMARIVWASHQPAGPGRSSSRIEPLERARVSVHAASGGL